MMLKLIRLTCGIDTTWEYDERTDVWIFGDVDGYRYLQSQLKAAIDSKDNTHLDEIEKCGTSMQCVILPALEKPLKRPKMKLVQRIIFKNDEPEMELIILGNKRSYEVFAEDIERIAQNHLDSLDYHLHYEDWWTPWLVKRSVSLNIRGPLSKWNTDNLQGYGSLIMERQPTYFPHSFENTTKDLYPYEEPVWGTGPYSL